MSRQTVIDYRTFQKVLDNFDVMTGGGAASLIRAHARLCAVQLAHWTQPVSVGQKGQGKAWEKGTTRVKYDIERIIRSDEKLLQISDHMYNEGIQARMRQLVESGNYQAVAQILKSTRVIMGFGGDSEILNSAGRKKSNHQSHRNKTTGRTYPKARKLFISDSQNNLNGYIKTAAQRVGKSKAGWADCARKINAVKGDGARGIPAWAKSKKHGNNGEVNDSSRLKPYGFVEMRNTLPWTSNILGTVEIGKAQAFAMQGLIRSLRRSFSESAKNITAIQDFLEREINLTNTGE